jgi:hypothetical protein
MRYRRYPPSGVKTLHLGAPSLHVCFDGSIGYVELLRRSPCSIFPPPVDRQGRAQR